MAKTTKAPAWALALAERLAASPTGTPAKHTPATKTAEKASKKAPKKKTAKVAPGVLARVLTGASNLPKSDPVRLACERRLIELLDEVQGDTTVLAELLGVDRRSAQRLRAAYGIERRLVNGAWQ